jgi:hypothetical protein
VGKFVVVYTSEVLWESCKFLFEQMLKSDGDIAKEVIGHMRRECSITGSDDALRMFWTLDWKMRVENAIRVTRNNRVKGIQRKFTGKESSNAS